ncbi:MAG: DinB family protein [Bacteroidetes bacterium]|nr:DinB family protein [Bacteroidota bacterium]
MQNEFGVVVPDWYKGYVAALDGADFIEVLKKQRDATPEFMNKINAELWDFAYAPGKWTIKEVLMHLIDCERIFCYRALCFARGDKSELPGFDENSYAVNSGCKNRTADSIQREYVALRNSTLELFSNFDQEMLYQTGTANGKLFSVKLSGVIIAGHEKHHINIIKERYLSSEKSI